ncbi:MAG: alpha/beta hydrolase-fold protein [Acidobacteriota bacterium]
MRRATSCVVLIFITGLALGADLPTLGTSFQIQSTVMQESRTIYVHLPDNYQRQSTVYPVLYMTDAESKFAPIVATAEFLARQGRMPAMIVVGVTNTSRTRDLTPTRASLPTNGSNMMQLPTSGGADRFLQFFRSELIPWVETRYRTTPYRAFCGHSLGGLFALHALATQTDLFQGVIAISPTLFWDNDLPLRELGALLMRSNRLDRTLFVSLGNEGPEMESAWARLATTLNDAPAHGLTPQLQRFMDEDHGSIVMLSAYHGLRKLFESWPIPTDPASGTILLDFDGIKQHYQTLSKQLGSRVRPPEQVLNRYGYQVLTTDQKQRAIEIFQYASELYPQSPNALDSLGEALGAIGDWRRATATYDAAVALAKKQRDPDLASYRARAASAHARLAETP